MDVYIFWCHDNSKVHIQVEIGLNILFWCITPQFRIGRFSFLHFFVPFPLKSSQVHLDSKGNQPSLEIQPQSTSPTLGDFFHVSKGYPQVKKIGQGCKHLWQHFLECPVGHKFNFISPLVSQLQSLSIENLGFILNIIRLWRYSFNNMTTLCIFWFHLDQVLVCVKIISDLLCFQDFL